MMPLPEIFALGILAYLVYRLVFNFFLPIYRTTRQVRQQFRHMRDTMNGNGSANGPGPSSGKASPGTDRNAAKPDQHPSFDSIGEYIDFEEVKK